MINRGRPIRSRRLSVVVDEACSAATLASARKRRHAIRLARSRFLQPRPSQTDGRRGTLCDAGWFPTFPSLACDHLHWLPLALVTCLACFPAAAGLHALLMVLASQIVTVDPSTRAQIAQSMSPRSTVADLAGTSGSQNVSVSSAKRRAP